MCQGEKAAQVPSSTSDRPQSPQAQHDGTKPHTLKRRGKRDKAGSYTIETASLPSSASSTSKPKKKKKQSKALQRHSKDSPSGGIESLLPSVIGIAVLGFGFLAHSGFRGRASVAGIDLGTTNSVICVQQQAKGVGTIDCIPDPASGSPIIPSVVSILQQSERPVGASTKIPSTLVPHPSAVIVGHLAKQRIESHPHHTLYHAKRVLGRDHNDPAIADLRTEVEYNIVPQQHKEVAFIVDDLPISPENVGSYVINHLLKIASTFLGHDNVKSAVIAVPAKFNTIQRQRTMEAFKNAGIKVARVLEEPTAAALAYGLHKKEGVEKILVYDFGGGTLDLSILHVSEGFVDVMGSDGDDRLGGADFDATVAALLSSRHADVLKRLGVTNPESLAASCPRLTPETPLCSVSSFHTLGERLKIMLASTGETATATCYGLVADTAESICENLVVIPIELTLEEYNRACQPLYDRAIIPAGRLLDDLTLEPDEIDEIVMVGGTTRMPQIRELVRVAFGNAQLNIHIDPDVTVAYGAASVID